MQVRGFGLSGWQRCLPPSDRQEEPDPMPRETALERVKRICAEKGWYVPAENERQPGEDG